MQLCRVNKRVMACPPSSAFPGTFRPATPWLPASRGNPEKTNVQVFHSEDDWGNRILVAGCDPLFQCWRGMFNRPGIELVLAHRNSSQSLDLLKEGCVHVAGTHLRDDASGESNVPQIAKMFPKNAVAVITFAVWEEGIVTARGNPKGHSRD